MNHVDAGRRRFLCVSLTAGGALLLGFRGAVAAPTPGVPPELLGDDLTAVGPFVRIERGNRIVIGARGCEVGQGVMTALPMLIAEELDVDWSQVMVVQLPYGYVETDQGASNLYGSQGADAGIGDAWTELRQAGAAARWLLRQAAANEWNLPVASLRTEAGEVIAPDGRRLSYGALARSAATLTLPPTPLPLKQPDRFGIIGKPTPTADARDIVTGRSRYGIDEYAANALVAVIVRCPLLGGSLESFDDSEARKVAGVVDVVALPGPAPGQPFDGVPAAGVAVLAEHTWGALKGREHLQVEWKPGAWADESSAVLARRANELLDDADSDAGLDVRRDGDFAQARKQARQVVEARYEMPFLAHATMEPPVALIEIGQDSARLTAAVEDPDGASRLIAKLTGLPRAKIEIRLTRAGGSFGRRLANDFVAEAVLLAKAAGKPVKLMWTREDDLQHDFYRPFGVHALAATLDRRKRITGWSHRCAATPLHDRDPRPNRPPSNPGNLEADDFPAGLVANLEKSFHALESGMPRGSWRASSHPSHAFAVQSFIDEIAIATRQDAVKLRLDLLGEPRRIPRAGGPDFDTGRLADVLRRCAERIGWGVRRTDGHGIGIACHFVSGGYAAHAFEVSVVGEELRIHRAICVADVGRVINPLGVEAQLMGGTLDGLSTTLNLAITVREGQVRQRSLRDYPLMRMAQAPKDVEVVIVESDAEPADAGDVGIASAAPALANAVHAATTVRVRKLPLMPELMRML